jgi:hypothetical protein
MATTFPFVPQMQLSEMLEARNVPSNTKLRRWFSGHTFVQESGLLLEADGTSWAEIVPNRKMIGSNIDDFIGREGLVLIQKSAHSEERP